MTDKTVGDADHLPTLDYILDQLPDGAGYEDAVESKDGKFRGWIGLAREAVDGEAGRATGTLFVSVDRGDDYEPEVVRQFRVTIEEIPRPEADR